MDLEFFCITYPTLHAIFVVVCLENVLMEYFLNVAQMEGTHSKSISTLISSIWRQAAIQQIHLHYSYCSYVPQSVEFYLVFQSLVDMSELQ